MPCASADDLASQPLFEELDEATLTTIAPLFEVEEASPGVRLTGQGSPGYSFYVLCDGTASVTVDGDEVNTLGPGDFFGELAILGDGIRGQTGPTTSPARLLVLFGTEFRQHEQDHPELVSRIQSGVSARL